MAKTITLTGADISLFHVAARELGDAQQWILLAQANAGRALPVPVDPMISGIIPNFRIPDPQPAPYGGLPPQ